MRPVEALIATATTADRLTVTVCYETPAGHRAIRTLERLSALGLSVVIATMAAFAVERLPVEFTSGQRLALMFVAAGAAYLASVWTSAQLADRRFGLRGVLDRRVEVGFAREAVVYGGRRFERTAKIAFTSEPHRLGRDEERAERVTGVLYDETYRIAHEVKLQHGETFVVLAEVSSSEAANAIVRRFQAADDLASRGAGAFNQGSVFGPRQRPE